MNLFHNFYIVRCRTSWGEPEREVPIYSSSAGRQADNMHAYKESCTSIVCLQGLKIIMPLEKVPSSACVADVVMTSLKGVYTCLEKL